MESFVGSVWRWKLSGIFFWSASFYAVFLLLGRLTRHLFHREFQFASYLSPLVFALPTVPLFFFSRSLTLVPARRFVLPLSEVKNQAAFFVSNFFWLFMHMSMYVSAAVSFKASLFLTSFLVMFLDFTAILNYSTNDVSNRGALLARFVLKYTPLSPFVATFAMVYFAWDTYTAIVVTATLALDIVFTIVAAIVCGEKTTFAKAEDASFLAEGLSRKYQIEQYWAYRDFLDVTKDQFPERRLFIYADAGKSFSKIVDTITDKINIMAEANFSIVPDEAKSKASNGLQRKIQAFINKYFFDKGKRRPRMVKEWKAVENSIIAMDGIQALVKMLFLANKEDKNGIVQVHAEKIFDAIVTLQRSCIYSQNQIKLTPPFPRIWIATDYADLLSLVIGVTDWAINNLLLFFGNKLDIIQLSNENVQYIRRIMSITSQMSSEQRQDYFNVFCI